MAKPCISSSSTKEQTIQSDEMFARKSQEEEVLKHGIMEQNMKSEGVCKNLQMEEEDVQCRMETIEKRGGTYHNSRMISQHTICDNATSGSAQEYFRPDEIPRKLQRKGCLKYMDYSKQNGECGGIENGVYC